MEKFCMGFLGGVILIGVLVNIFPPTNVILKELKGTKCIEKDFGVEKIKKCYKLIEITKE